MFCWVSSSCFLALERSCESRRVRGGKRRKKNKTEREAAVGGWEEGVVLTAFHS